MPSSIKWLDKNGSYSICYASVKIVKVANVVQKSKYSVNFDFSRLWNVSKLMKNSSEILAVNFIVNSVHTMLLVRK